jgi:hypothetical protein
MHECLVRSNVQAMFGGRGGLRGDLAIAVTCRRGQVQDLSEESLAFPDVMRTTLRHMPFVGQTTSPRHTDSDDTAIV